MTFLADESSVQGGRPRELFEITQNLITVYRVASGDRDVDYDGNTYTASPIARSEVGVSTSASEKELTLVLPLKHPLAQRYYAQGSPPRQISIVVYRKQLDSGEVRQVFAGHVISMAIERHVAKFLIQTRSARAFTRKLPVIIAGRLCPHILYDSRCRLHVGDFAIRAVVTNVNGRIVTVDALGGQPDDWAKFGDLTHVPTGERMTIFGQTGLVITMQAPIPEIRIGDFVDVAPGCAHDVDTCRDKFDNVVNFGGFPHMPVTNPFDVQGYGVTEEDP